MGAESHTRARKTSTKPGVAVGNQLTPWNAEQGEIADLLKAYGIKPNVTAATRSGNELRPFPIHWQGQTIEIGHEDYSGKFI